jgi:effector-binding domain-containing protein
MKKLLYVILGIIVLYFILALMGPKEMKVERSVAINAPAESIRQKLGDFRFFHDKWSPWTRRDTAMKTTYSGTPGEPGHMHSWAGNKEVGEGEMEYAGVRGDTVIHKLRFKNRPEGEAYYIVGEEGDVSKVTWGMSMPVGFLFRTPMLFMKGKMDKMMGDDFDEGLQNLKKAIEGDKAEVRHYDIDEQKWEERTFISTKKERIRGEECSAFLGANLPKIYADLGKAGIQPVMAPSMIFYSWDEKTMMTECVAAMAVPSDDKKAKEKINGLKNWEKCIVPESKVLHIAYYGDYGKNMDAHVAIENYMKEKNYLKDLVIEEYVSDPTVEKDTARWLTNIYYVVKDK